MSDANEKPNAGGKPGRQRQRAKVVPETTPEEIRRNVIVLANGIGVTPPEEAGSKPALDVVWPLQVLARELGQLARGCELFRQGEAFVTVDSRTGELRPMDAPRFCSWVETVAWTFKSNKDGKPAFSRMVKETAALILAADSFREHIPELRGVHVVRLPVWRGQGADRTIELLPEGFDAETGIYSVDTVPFDQDWSSDQARLWMLEVLSNYPFADRRSYAAHIAAMLSPFVRLLLPTGAKKPMIVYNGNQPGTGKSTLARMALFPVYGEAPARSVDRNPEELRKVLETTAIERKPFLFLDDMGDLRSRELNMFLTSGRMSARVLGQSRTMEVPIEAQVFLTGNQLDIGRELDRRTLVVDLFLPTDPLERRFAQEITDEWLLLPETRAACLAFLWSCVRRWRDAGMPRDPEAYRPSFEAYASRVGSIVKAAEFGAPFAPRSNALGGDEEGEAMQELLKAIAEQVETGETKEFRPVELLAIAEERGLLDAIAPHAKDPRKKVGHKLREWRGRQLRDSKGRLFEFGRRDGNRGAIYPVSVMEG